MKKRTKKELVEEKILLNEEDILSMEIVRDFNLTSDHAEAKIQVDAANDKIKKAEIQITWLKQYLKTLD